MTAIHKSLFGDLGFFKRFEIFCQGIRYVKNLRRILAHYDSGKLKDDRTLLSVYIFDLKDLLNSAIKLYAITAFMIAVFFGVAYIETSLGLWDFLSTAIWGVSTPLFVIVPGAIVVVMLLTWNYFTIDKTTHELMTLLFSPHKSNHLELKLQSLKESSIKNKLEDVYTSTVLFTFVNLSISNVHIQYIPKVYTASGLLGIEQNRLRGKGKKLSKDEYQSAGNLMKMI